MKLKIHYFGTNLTEHGHYFWDVSNGAPTDKYNKPDNIDFNQYEFKYQKRGDIDYLKTPNYSVIGICGSPVDHRGGTVSVFFTKEDLTKEQFLDILKGNTFFQKLTEMMDIEI